MFTHGLMHRRAAWMRRLAMSLTLALGFLPVSSLMPAAYAQGTMPTAQPVKSLLLFPATTDSTVTAAPTDLSARLDDAIKLRLALIGSYTVVSYSRFLPSVQRAINESADGGLTDADIQPPFDPGKGQKIASLVGTDAYLITTITSYTQDPTSRRVSIGVSSRAFYSQSTGALPIAVPNLAIVTNGVAGPTSASDSDADIQQGAINDAAARIVSLFNAAAPRAKAVVATSQRGSGRGAAYVLGAIVIGALIYAAIAGSHFGGGGGSSSGSGVATTTTTSSGPPSPPSGVTTTTGSGTPTPPAPPTTSVRR